MSLFGGVARQPKRMGNAPWYVGGGFGDDSGIPQPRQQGIGTGRMIAGTIGDALLRIGGSQPVFAPAMQYNFRQRMEQLQHDRDLEDARNTWVQRQEYEQTHPNQPVPTEFERSMVAAGILPGSEEYATMSRQRATNLANPLAAIDVQQPDGSTVRQFIRPGQQGGGSSPAPPRVGEVRGGRPYLGGNPASPSSWGPRAGGAGSAAAPAIFR